MPVRAYTPLPEHTLVLLAVPPAGRVPHKSLRAAVWPKRGSLLLVECSRYGLGVNRRCLPSGHCMEKAVVGNVSPALAITLPLTALTTSLQLVKLPYKLLPISFWLALRILNPSPRV